MILHFIYGQHYGIHYKYKEKFRKGEIIFKYKKYEGKKNILKETNLIIFC